MFSQVFSETVMNTFVKFAISVVIALIAVIAYQNLQPSNQAKHEKPVTAVEANALIKKHAELYAEERITKVTDHVYVAVGFAIANMILLEGKDGIIIVDTTESPVAARKVFKEFRKITQKPLKGIILTHFHADHVLGSQALIDDVKDSGVEVRVFKHSSSNFENSRFITSGDIGYKRGSRQFGSYLEPGSEHVDSGIGPKLLTDENMDYAVAESTDTFDKEKTYSLAGITFTLIHTPGETDDQLTVWIPDWRVVLPADNVYESFPNLYAIRGTPPRDCTLWIQSLDKVRHLRAKYMVPSHINPLEGEENIFNVITHYRDAIQFVNDQTIRWMNAGLDIDEIVERVQLPPSLASHPYLQQFYGTVAWSVRAAYNGQLGWFDGDPVNLYPLSKQKRSEKLEELLSTNFRSGISGTEQMLKKAQECLDKSFANFKATGYVLTDDLQWSLELSCCALKVTQPDSPLYQEAKRLAVASLKSLATSTMNSNARNYYLTSAKELDSGLVIALSQKSRTDVVKTLKISEIMKQFQFRFNAQLCDDTAILKVIFSFPDVNETYSYTVRHCILECNDNLSLIPKEFDAKISMSSAVWKNILRKERSPLGAYASGDLVLEGSMMSFKQFMDLLVKF